MFNLITRLPSQQDKKVFVFSTSGYGTAKLNQKIINELTKKGFKIIGSFACKGFDTAGINKLYGGAAKGRLNEANLQEARTFAKNFMV